MGFHDDSDVLLTPQQLEHELAFWIEGYYNSKWRHLTLGYRSPIAYERQFIAICTLTLSYLFSVTTKQGRPTS